MMNKITNRKIICDVLCQKAEHNKNIIVLCSDSRGSASLSPFAEKYPNQFVEMGIAEQNLVSVAAGIASCGKKTVVASPACFLSTRSYEQIKIDVAYSKTNVLLLGISGGVSYGALGMSHHSCQDISSFSSLPGMKIYLPSDRFLTKLVIEELLKDDKPSYVRISRSATEDVYNENLKIEINKAKIIKEGNDLGIISCGEMVPYAKQAAKILEERGIHARVIDMYCLKPIDKNTIIETSKKTKFIVTVEEHSVFGGLGSLVSQILSFNNPTKVIQIALPDEHLIPGKNFEIFNHYKMDAIGIANTCEKAVKEQ
jgi:transketolase